MRVDIDAFLLDRLFQPMADRTAGWISCFGLARVSLGVAIVTQLVVVAADLSRFGSPMERAAVGAIVLLAMVGGEQAWRLIARSERQARPGAMNVRRITLRWQRLAWLGVTSWSVVAGVDAGGGGLCCSCAAWVALIYFVSCTPTPPSARLAWRAFA